MTCICCGGLCQRESNLEKRLSVSGEVSLCAYPTPAGTEADSWFGRSVPALTNQNGEVWPGEKSMGRWNRVIRHSSKIHISTVTGQKKQVADCDLKR